MANGLKKQITGRFSGAPNALRLRIDVYQVSQSGNTSNVRLDWVAWRTTSEQITHDTAHFSQTLDGTTSTPSDVYFDIRTYSVNQEYIFKQTTATVTHGSDGKKTFAVSGTVNLSGTSAGIGSFSDSVTLDQIATTPPTVSSLSISDQWSGKPSSITGYIAGYSRIRITANASPVSPASLASYSFYNGSTLLGTVNTSSGSASYTYPSANTAGNYQFKVVVKDTFGNTTTYPSSVPTTTVQSYSPPTITATTFRCNSSGTADGSGTCLSCKADWTFSNVVGNTITSATRKVGSASAVSIINSKNQPVVLTGYSASSTYTVTYTVTDTVGNSASIVQTVNTEFVNFDLYPNNSTGGAAFGQVAQSGRLDINMPTYANGNIYVGDLNSNTERYVDARSSSGRILLDATSSQRGLWTAPASGSGAWVITIPSGSNTATFNGNATSATTATTAGNVSGTVTVGHGGTGATSAAAARTNLEVRPVSLISSAITSSGVTVAAYDQYVAIGYVYSGYSLQSVTFFYDMLSSTETRFVIAQATTTYIAQIGVTKNSDGTITIKHTQGSGAIRYLYGIGKR